MFTHPSIAALSDCRSRTRPSAMCITHSSSNLWEQNNSLANPVATFSGSAQGKGFGFLFFYLGGGGGGGGGRGDVGGFSVWCSSRTNPFHTTKLSQKHDICKMSNTIPATWGTQLSNFPQEACPRTPHLINVYTSLAHLESLSTFLGFTHLVKRLLQQYSSNTAEYVALSAAWFTVQNAFKEWTTTTTKVKLSRLWAHPRFCFIVVDSAGQYRGATAGGGQRVNMETPFPIQATLLAQTDQIILTRPTYLPRRLFSLNVNQGVTKLELSTSVLLLNGFARERKQNIL